MNKKVYSDFRSNRLIGSSLKPGSVLSYNNMGAVKVSSICRNLVFVTQFCTDLIVPVLLQEVSGHVAGEDVPQHVLVVFS